MDGLSLTVCCEQQRMICLWQSVVNNKGWFVFDSLLWTTVEDLLLTVCCEQQWTVCHLQSVVSNKGWFVVDSLLWTRTDNLSLTVCCEQQKMLCRWQSVVSNSRWFVADILLWTTMNDFIVFSLTLFSCHCWFKGYKQLHSPPNHPSTHPKRGGRNLKRPLSESR